jgi:hypothetical protein
LGLLRRGALKTFNKFLGALFRAAGIGLEFFTDPVEYALKAVWVLGGGLVDELQ